MGQRNAGAGERLLLGLAGLGAGLLAGFALAAWTGRVSGARVKSAARRIGAPIVDPDARTPKPPRAVVRGAEALLAADLQLAPLGLTCVPLGRTGLELHGWVPSRALRTRAARLVREAPGVDEVVNCLLVHGEDDRDVLPDADTAEQTPPTPQTA